jgi:hypothetical protein
MPLTNAEIEDLFTYHAPKPGQPERYDNIRQAAKHLAKVIIANTPEGADQIQSILAVRSATMFANASIALEKDPV